MQARQAIYCDLTEIRQGKRPKSLCSAQEWAWSKERRSQATEPFSPLNASSEYFNVLVVVGTYRHVGAHRCAQVEAEATRYAAHRRRFHRPVGAAGAGIDNAPKSQGQISEAACQCREGP